MITGISEFRGRYLIEIHDMKVYPIHFEKPHSVLGVSFRRQVTSIKRCSKMSDNAYRIYKPIKYRTRYKLSNHRAPLAYPMPGNRYESLAF